MSEQDNLPSPDNSNSSTIYTCLAGPSPRHALHPCRRDSGTRSRAGRSNHHHGLRMRSGTNVGLPAAQCLRGKGHTQL